MIFLAHIYRVDKRIFQRPQRALAQIKVLVRFCWSLKNLLVPIHSKLHLKSCDYLYKYGRQRDVIRKRFIRWIKIHVYAKRQT